MATTVTDRDGNRTFTIDAHSAACPGSVFILGPQDFCMEFNRADIVRAFKLELGIVETLEVSVDRFLASVA